MADSFKKVSFKDQAEDSLKEIHSDKLIMTDFGRVKPVGIVKEMEKSYLDYAMSVIVARALPDVRDGLKPVHRRILYAMKDMGLTSTASYKKSARIVGEVLGKYHPHGDQAVYQTLVRLAQAFSMRYPLVDGQGNFGSVDGDSPAAMRYTEAKLAKISEELLVDLDKETVNWVDTFDSSQQEPSVLPAKLPNLLLMGSEGIAVGMATKIPPHNLKELIAALNEFLEKSKVENIIEAKQTEKIEEMDPKLLAGQFSSEASVEELLTHIKGPDFPTGGAIYNWTNIKEAYSTGRGKIIMRAICEILEVKGKNKIVISELPYQVNKAKLIQKIADLVKNKKILGITDIRDESDRRGLQVVIEIKKGARPRAILNNLYSHTSLQTTFPVNMVALVDSTPQLLNLKTILTEYIKHRQLVVVRRSQFELKAAKLRAHILEGLKIALDNLDEVIATIRRSKDSEVARERLIKKFGLTKIQAEAILNMQLRRLSALERQKIEDEYQALQKTIEILILLLTNPKKVIKIILKELKELEDKYGDARRTKVYRQSLDSFSEEDLVAKTPALLMLTKTGYIKRLPVGTYRSQHRGGKGVTGMSTKEADDIAHLTSCTTHDNVLLFTNKGRVFTVRAYDIPEVSRQSKGQAIINLINIDQGETIQSIVCVENIAKQKGHLFMATKQGMVKKTAINKFAKIKTNGLIAIRLGNGDQLIKVAPTSGEEEIFLVTYLGKVIRFSEKDVRTMGRATKGVKGINLKPEDYVMAAEVIHAKMEKPTDKRRKFFRDLIIATEKGLGKRTSINLFPMQRRAGAGVKVAKLTPKSGNLACAAVVTELVKQVLLTTKKAQVIKLPLKNIKRLGRNTQGVILMRFSKENDKVADITCLEELGV